MVIKYPEGGAWMVTVTHKRKGGNGPLPEGVAGRVSAMTPSGRDGESVL